MRKKKRTNDVSAPLSVSIDPSRCSCFGRSLIISFAGEAEGNARAAGPPMTAHFAPPSAAPGFYPQFMIGQEGNKKANEKAKHVLFIKGAECLAILFAERGGFVLIVQLLVSGWVGRWHRRVWPSISGGTSMESQFAETTLKESISAPRNNGRRSRVEVVTKVLTKL